MPKISPTHCLPMVYPCTFTSAARFGSILKCYDKCLEIIRIFDGFSNVLVIDLETFLLCDISHFLQKKVFCAAVE